MRQSRGWLPDGTQRPALGLNAQGGSGKLSPRGEGNQKPFVKPLRGTDKLTQGHGLELHELGLSHQKRVIMTDFRSCMSAFVALNCHFSSRNKLTCQYP